MTQHTAKTRVRWWMAIAGVCAVLAVGAGVMTAGVGMPRLPPSIRVDAPDVLRVSDASGATAELRLINGVSPTVDPRVSDLDRIDEESYTAAEVPVDADIGFLMPGEEPPASRQVRGQGVDESGELGDMYDPLASYVLIDDGEGTVLPEETDLDGDRTAAKGSAGLVVEVDDPAVSRLFPGYNRTVREESGAEAEAPAWDVQFDLAAAHEQGRTNLPLPLGWYASPFAKGLDAAAPWLLGGFILATLLALALARWESVSGRRSAEAGAAETD
ncbi:hypothetical protein [Agromyces sp. NBRC 114283]|uniref:hypothetical protein n=1 Tax=Agromyces sp. NBRC 114283 TaxID=2994521 RepID=UPI0025543F07|nr:hypothetical protein [Agromyces sp. NBRC 114283]